METEVEQREDGVVDDSMHGFGAFLGLKAMLHRLSALESKVTGIQKPPKRTATVAFDVWVSPGSFT
eukprot:2097722-Amphidinium_carterae.1